MSWDEITPAGGTEIVRADSACYSVAFGGVICRVGARFWVMVQIDPKIAAAIAAVGYVSRAGSPWLALARPRPQ
jgi:hypothetical protein